MFEDILSALQNFRHNKMRTLLSLLGIMIGVCSVVITMNLSRSLEASVALVFKDFSSSIVAVWPSSWRNSAITFNDRYADMLKKRVPQIKRVFGFDTFNASVMSGRLNAGSKECYGIEYGYMEAQKWHLEYGTLFTASDFMAGAQKVIIGEDIAKGLFPEGSAVGKTLTLSVNNGNAAPLLFTCTVIGVLKTKETAMGQMQRYVLIPRSFMAMQLGRREADLVDVELYDTVMDIEAVEEAIKVASDEYANSKNTVRIWSAQSMQKQIQSSLAMIAAVLSGIAGLSLLIGGVGIMNIMLVTVAERRQEIGIRKAIGATTGAILSQFLTESAAISIVGGGIGLAAGFLISLVAVTPILSQFSGGSDVVLSFNMRGALMAFLISAGAGIFFGLYPAWQAGKLDPVKALEE
ncbi:FtsX-like permease family protein [Treponema medium]|uniref:ABC transporter permease n=1 Tax=Treponema medium TaxID=58231 RepID=UPI001980BAB9|nr:ABC transporter permease [Treponema medium]QSH92037.1 FtsX-like permease family protein [Treponema medium]